MTPNLFSKKQIKTAEKLEEEILDALFSALEDYDDPPPVSVVLLGLLFATASFFESMTMMRDVKAVGFLADGVSAYFNQMLHKNIATRDPTTNTRQ